MDTLFYRLGLLTYKYRSFIIWTFLCSLLLAMSIMLFTDSPFKVTGFVDETAKSTQASNFLAKNLAYPNYNKLLISYYSAHLRNNTHAFDDAIARSVEPLYSFPIPHLIFYPKDNIQQRSRDRHTAYVVIMFKTDKPLSDVVLAAIKHRVITPAHMRVLWGGEPEFIDAVNDQTEKDLIKADMIAAPVSIITLLLIFGSVLAAILPMLLGGGCALLTISALYGLGHITALSIFTLNIALLLGICVSLDYALFIITRFREELSQHQNICAVIATTLATAGRAVFFSGIAVMCSLSALFLFPVNILFSVAAGGCIAIIVSLLLALLVLPAILACLRQNINRWPVNLCKNKQSQSSQWRRWAVLVVDHPRSFLTIVLIILATLGLPLYWVDLGVADYKIFPEQSPKRAFFDKYGRSFDLNELTPIILLIKNTRAAVLSQGSLKQLYQLKQNIQKNKMVKTLNGIVSLQKHLTPEQYYALYHVSKHYIQPNLKKLLITTTGHTYTVMTIVSRYLINDEHNEVLVKWLEQLKPQAGMQVELTGQPVANQDLLNQIKHMLPYAVIWVMIFTFINLFLLLRSLILPIKAIVMNLLSLLACYGALVWVFQLGHGHMLLDFEPQGVLDVSLFVIIFCALFGFSMDYEVFLLSRIKEAYDKTHDYKQSIIEGIEQSAGIISSAALIVIVISGVFLVAQIVMVKAFGLGIVVAIGVDAFLIRVMLVPAVLALFKNYSWYCPRVLQRLQRR